MSSDADVAAPGIELPEGDQSEAQTGVWQRALDNLRTGNLGVLPIVVTARDLRVVAVRFSIAGSFSVWNQLCSSRPRYMF